MIDKKLYEELKKEINSIEIFDAHEHLPYEYIRSKEEVDFFSIFMHSCQHDFITSGLEIEIIEKLLNRNIDLKTRYDFFIPFWKYVNKTSNARKIKIAIKDLFGYDNIDYNTVKKVSEKLNDMEAGHYENILKKKSRIEYIVNDLIYPLQPDPDKDYYLPATRFRDIIMIHTPIALNQIEKEYDVNIYDLGDFIDLVDMIFEKNKNKFFAFKIVAAYLGGLDIKNSTYRDAELSFNKILNNRSIDCDNATGIDYVTLNDIKSFRDFIYQYSIKKTIEYNIPVQIHTGVLAGNFNDIRKADPTQLIELMLKYKRAKFDLFHIGYPYTDELITMARMLPNAYFDLCWISQISESLYKNTLNLLIDLVPAGKIFGFGGDATNVELVYSNQKVTREIITEFLYEKVKSKYLTFEEAVEFAKQILSESPKNIYLKNKKERR